MPKNIVLLFDGTKNQPGQNKDTNILKMHDLLINDQKTQSVFYFNGIANMPSKVLSLFQLVTGSGINEKIKQGYEILIKNYEPGDQVFLYGFSRGAFTARSLAGKVAAIGLIKDSSKQLIDLAYDHYTIFSDLDTQTKFKKKFSRTCPIHLIGVYDTVETLLSNLFFSSYFTNWGKKRGYKRNHNVELLSENTYAYQALALDDTWVRSYKPVLWNINAYPRVQQVWFAGSHKDIGGPSLTAGVADVALRWMLSLSMTKGLLVDPKKFASLNPNCTGALRKTKGFGRRKLSQSILIHRSVKTRMQTDPRYRTLSRIPLAGLTFTDDAL
ncbi:MAG: DUF2235 domain-containing protein [Bdellovibrionaceae bacterium]|nr:DUF2235 domain-containing protein [Bdellovibrio sp.]